MDDGLNIAFTGFCLLLLAGVFMLTYGCKPKSIGDDSSYTKIATVTENNKVILVDVNPHIDITTEYLAKDYRPTFFGKIYTFKKNGMEYLFISYDGGMQLMNLTIDSLRVEKLKRKLQEDVQ